MVILRIVESPPLICLAPLSVSVHDAEVAGDASLYPHYHIQRNKLRASHLYLLCSCSSPQGIRHHWCSFQGFTTLQITVQQGMCNKLSMSDACVKYRADSNTGVWVHTLLVLLLSWDQNSTLLLFQFQQDVIQKYTVSKYFCIGIKWVDF